MKSPLTVTRQTATHALAILFLLPAIPSQAQESDQPIRYEASHDAMGTIFTLVAYGRDERFLAQVANEAFDEIDSLDAQMSNYRAESELSRINRRAAQEPVLVEPRLFDLLAMAIRYSVQSDGAFDISVGPLMKTWGFFQGEGRVPPKAELDRVRKRVGYRHILLDREQRTIRFDAEGLELDLGGIAKGYAVDRVAGILRANGVNAALISSGRSSIYALGAPPGKAAWRIHLRDPFEGKKAAGDVLLKDFSLSVSGSYEKLLELDGKTYCHILDPRTGWPVEGMLMTAVLAPRGVESDATSTILFVLGPEKGRRYLEKATKVSALLFESAGGRKSNRVALKSDEFILPSGCVAEFELGPEDETR